MTVQKPAAKPTQSNHNHAKAPAQDHAKAPIQRRDASGHLDPKYAADLRAKSGSHGREDDDKAFLGGRAAADSVVERLGEDFVSTATSGEGASETTDDRVESEDLGGPFVVTSANTEFARGTDESNPKGATREPFPRT